MIIFYFSPENLFFSPKTFCNKIVFRAAKLIKYVQDIAAFISFCSLLAIFISHQLRLTCSPL